MSELQYRNGSQFRLWSQLGRSAAGVGVAAVIGCFLVQLLELTSDQWRWFATVTGAYALVYAAVTHGVLGRLDGPIRQALDAEASGQLDDERLRRGFAAALRFPVHGIVFSLAAWLGAGLAIPALMMVRHSDIPVAASLAVLVFTIGGGVTCAVLTYLLDRRMVEDLRDRWATRLRDPAERERLVRPLTLGSKLRVSLTALILSTALLAAVVSDMLSRRPIEDYATRIQTGYLERMAIQLDGPDDPVLRIARRDMDELGIAEHLIVVDRRDGSIADGPEDALTESERAWIVRDGGSGGMNSMGLESIHAFAWVPIEVDDDYALATVMDRAALTGNVTATRVLLGLLALFLAGVGLACAHFLARDVGNTAARLRSEAERIAGGDLTQGTVVESDDELGELARVFERMAGSLRAMVGRVAETADGVESAAQAIAEAGGSVAEATSEQTRALDRSRSSMRSVNDEISGLAQSVQVLNGNVEEASGSVLELGAAGEHLNQTAASLSDQVETSGTSIEEMVRSVRSIGENAEALSGAAAETSTSMTRMADSMRDVESNASETARLSSRVVTASESGRERVHQTIAGMDAIREATETVQTTIGGLGSRIHEIGAIIDVIDDVADETSLLALNAAIIAAQAGDQGRAFSVVADEISELADRVLASTKEIAGLIRAVQDESGNAVAAIEGGAERVQQGVDLAAEAGISLEEITAAARDSGERIEDIVRAVQEQTRAAAHVADLMERVSEGVGVIRSAGEEQERSNEVLMNSTTAVRDVAQQVSRTTDEQARGASLIRDSVESVRHAVDRMQASLEQQSESCGEVASGLEQIFGRTRSNEEAATRLNEATRSLRAQSEALREDLRRFRT
ncbi:MAG: methyl-accepting chemotaxis protein [Myxococcota bacterium]